MSKQKIVDVAGEEVSQYVPKVRAAQPFGTQVLVELLSPEDIMGPTKLHIPKGSQTLQGAPQGYIRAFGPSVKTADWGFEVGDRVVLQGNFVPLPEAVCNNGRMMSLVEPYAIKAKLIEN